MVDGLRWGRGGCVGPEGCRMSVEGNLILNFRSTVIIESLLEIKFDRIFSLSFFSENSTATEIKIK